MKPFLKWAGGKHRLLDEIIPELPAGERLVEPFTGSAAVFMGTGYNSYLLADSNSDLINLYKCLAAEAGSFIAAAAEFFSAESNTPGFYYNIREQFNRTPLGPEKALYFLYLNRHAYNGLCRYNSKGIFNTPFGSYKRPYFPEVEMRNFVAKYRRADVEFVCYPFETTFKMLRKGDVVYCDPPYWPLSCTASFTRYSAGDFKEKDHSSLAELAYNTSRANIPVFISNHDMPHTRSLYRKAKRKTFPASRMISCKGSGRKKVMELLACYRAENH